MSQQQHDLNQLTQALHEQSNDLPRAAAAEEDLPRLVRTSVDHFQDYADQRARLAHLQSSAGPSLLSPTWCSPLENSCLWLGGCRPSLFVRLVYSLSGSDLEARLPSSSAECDAGTSQLFMLNELHCRAIREEERVTGRLATAQESMADWSWPREEMGKAVEDSAAALGGWWWRRTGSGWTFLRSSSSGYSLRSKRWSSWRLGRGYTCRCMTGAREVGVGLPSDRVVDLARRMRATWTAFWILARRCMGPAFEIAPSLGQCCWFD
ncbi:hypothetical protein Syun_004853 [Stephania yunnanensis]|uniref:DOG1 domain-containing protein n=1 Tax=Stephania yunnanensis TaxID=152371 RepID=A0AAP0L478_9MAGN